jgi:hypothetical protein
MSIVSTVKACTNAYESATYPVTEELKMTDAQSEFFRKGTANLQCGFRG